MEVTPEEILKEIRNGATDEEIINMIENYGETQHSNGVDAQLYGSC